MKYIIEKAREFATKKHSGQYRRDGVTPYIVHPEKVASMFDDNSTKKIVALLHDTIEDTDTTYEEISELFGQGIADDVITLTHNWDETYDEYINKVKKSIFCTEIKIADIVCNLSDNPTEKQIKKYYKTLVRLTK